MTAVAALTIPASAQSDDDITGRIVARKLDDGRVEFGWQPTGGQRILPRQRYFPATGATVDRWLRSSPVEVGGSEIGRINARLLSDGRIEFAFTPTDGERILTDARYFPTTARANRWLRSTEITVSTPSPFIAVSAGSGHSCGLRESGELECWGWNRWGQIDVPEGSFTSVSAGMHTSCAIRDTGEIACWGMNENGETDAPEGSFIAISVGQFHACAIAEMFAGTGTVPNTGEIECWGKLDGSNDAPEGRFSSISARHLHTCAIRDTGEIACWRTADGPDSWQNEGKTINPPAGSFTAVSIGYGNNCAIRDTGEVTCWDDSTDQHPDPPPHPYIPTGSFATVSVGSYACGLRETGEVECWTSHGGDQPSYWGLEGNLIALSISHDHSCAIREGGTIVCQGDNEYGQTDAPTR